MKIFEIGSNGNIRDMERILEEFNADIYSVYIPPPASICMSGRAGKASKDINQMMDHVRLCRQFGVKTQIAMNSLVEDGNELGVAFRERILGFLKLLMDEGVDEIITNNPIIMKHATRLRSHEKSKLKILTGVWSEISCKRDVQLFEELGVNGFTVSVDINHDFVQLREIRKATTKTLVILANDACIYRCPFRFVHRNSVCYQSKIDAEDFKKMSNKTYMHYCETILHNSALEICKSTMIRPEDIDLYLGKLGINVIKLATRTYDYNWFREVVTAYKTRNYDGDLGKFIFRHIKPTRQLSNRSFDNMLTEIFSNPDNAEDIYLKYASRIDNVLL